MASSGSYDFTVTRDQIIEHAYKRTGLVGEGETPSSVQVTEAAMLLNMIVKLRHADGMPAWALKRGFILPFTDASSINTNSHVVTTYDTTVLTADSAATDTTLTVESITGFSASDQLGIELDDGTVQWTTVSGAPAGSTITIASGVTSAASTGNRVYGYTASTERVQKPIRIIQANTLNIDSESSSEIDIEDEADYFNLSQRNSAGIPNLIYYTIRPSSDTALETNGIIYVYPRFLGGDTIIEFTYQRPLQDFDASSDNPDFPQAFYLPLTLELAWLLGTVLPKEERDGLRDMFIFYHGQALMTVSPEGSMSIQPDSD